ncbi:hypothetical protein TRAPUB_9468 [Trametes pubescens]|uniref:Uncharacterized protein n=1 Tax=Trametes pubescens TaxID=154538 RepID=A0A1M2W2A6_TRAPU|nr:hypothetical protein TRAPUB_9468 [Trametes pubescens]
MTYPCPDAWKKSHCSCCIFSSKLVAEILPSGSYFSTRAILEAKFFKNDGDLPKIVGGYMRPMSEE